MTKKVIEYTEYEFYITEKDLPEIAKFINEKSAGNKYDLKFLHDLKTKKKKYKKAG